MARWMVNRNDAPYAVDGLGELRELARKGALLGGDMIQPPGATGWLYAADIPELRDALKDDPSEYIEAGGGEGSWGNVIVGGLLVLGILAAGAYSYERFTMIPDGSQTILGDNGLKYSELVVTSSGITLRAEPAGAASAVVELPKDSVLDLLAKRGEFYKAKDQASGQQGWVAADQVLPVYLLGGGEVRDELDPLYNPDQYVEVANASWMQLPEAKARSVTVFQFLLTNKSGYDMTDLVLVARMKDSKGHDVGEVEFEVEGIVPARGDTMVGTMVDPETKESRLITQVSFAALAAQDPELRLQYTEGVEVKQEEDEFNEATLNLVELRAVPR